MKTYCTQWLIVQLTNIVLSSRINLRLSLHNILEMDKKLFLSDEPIEEFSQDAFGHKAFVDTLQKCISDSDTGINIGLFGKWGVGKTSIIKLLVKKISKESQNITTFLFDAWKYSKLSLCHELVLELNKAFKVYNQDKLEREIYGSKEEEIAVTEEDWKSSPKKIFQRFSVSIYVTLFLLLLFILLWYLKLIDPATYNKLIFIVLLPIIVDLVIKMNKVVGGVSTVSLPPAKLDPRRIENKFEKIVSDITKGKKENKLVIMIDNLDRCSSETAIGMLEAIKTLMEHKKCIYLISCNEDALIRNLVSDKRYSPNDAKEFLGKFFQTSLTIPSLLPKDLERYTDELMSSLQIEYSGQVLEVIINAFLEDPRKIKQFLNNLTMQYITAQEREKAGIFDSGEITSDDGVLAKVLVIRQEYRAFYEELNSRQEVLVEAEEFFKGVGEPPTYKSVKGKQSGKTNIFDDNPGLEYFLRGTRLITVEDISPFLKLNRETYPSTIPDAQEFKLQVNRGNIDFISNEFNKIEQESEKVKYVREIARLIDDNINAGQYDRGFYGVDILTKIYQQIPVLIKGEIAAKIGHYMTLREIRGNLDKFVIDFVFPILRDMKRRNSDDILNQYTILISPDDIDESLINKLIEHYDVMSEAAIQHLNNTLIEAYDKNRENAVVIIRKINENPEISKRLLIDNLAAHIENSIENSASEENQKVVDQYLELKHLSSVPTKLAFLRKLLSIISTNKNTVYDETKKFGLRNLVKVNTSDIPDEGINELYASLDEFTGLVASPNDKLQFVEASFRFLGIFTDPQQEQYLQSQVLPLVNSGDAAILKRTLGIAEQYSVKLLNYEFMLDGFANRVRSNFPDSELISLITRSTPKQNRDKVKEMIIHLINQPQPPQYTAGLESFKQLYNEFTVSQVSEISEACLQKSVSAPPQEKSKYIMPIIESFNKNIVQFKRRFADFTADFIVNDEPDVSDMGIECFNKINDSIEADKRKTIIIQVIRAMEQKANQDVIDEDSEPLLDLVMAEQGILDRGDLERLIDMLLSLRNEAKNKETRLRGIKYLAQVTKFYQRKKIVIGTLQTDSESADAEIEEQARLALESITGKDTKKGS